jgi:hypothetical protein
MRKLLQDSRPLQSKHGLARTVNRVRLRTNYTLLLKVLFNQYTQPACSVPPNAYLPSSSSVLNIQTVPCKLYMVVLYINTAHTL